MNATTTTTTRDDIEKLKQAWRGDPCWDIEDTEGFEEHRAELVAFREQCEAEWKAAREAEWKAAREAKWLAKAESVGCPGNLKLGEYLANLEGQLEALEGGIYLLKYPLG